MESANVIGAGIRVKGTVSGAGSLTIHGRVEGAVRVGGDVRVAPSALVAATVDGAEVLVAGKVRGPVTATKAVTLASGADVEGDITAARVGIDPQARFVGHLKMELDLPRGLGGARGGARW